MALDDDLRGGRDLQVDGEGLDQLQWLAEQRAEVAGFADPVMGMTMSEAVRAEELVASRLSAGEWDQLNQQLVRVAGLEPPQAE